jgi:Diphthamide synthase
MGSWRRQLLGGLALDPALAIRHHNHPLEGDHLRAAVGFGVCSKHRRHGVRRSLLERQATSLGIPLQQILISKGATGRQKLRYLSRDRDSRQRSHPFSPRIPRYCFLRIRAYRERLLAKHKMVGTYPVWGRDTSQLIREFMASGFKAVVVCVDPAKLDSSFVGRDINEDFLSRLPPHVDPCGENGEFHTFVFDGPIFRNRVRFSLGEVVFRDLFWFCDLLPAE